MTLIRVAIAVALVLATSTPTGAVAAPTPENQILGAVNAARTSRGLVPLRSDQRLWVVAKERAGTMAAVGLLSHGAAGSLKASLVAQGITCYNHAEVVAYSAGAADAADELLRLWAGSPSHWALLMSDSFNYLGIGLAATSDGVTYGSILLMESNDVTGARGTMLAARVSGDDVRWTWRGTDPLLQSHTAGLRDFAVQRRMDRGPWMGVISSTTSTARTTSNLARGHWYGFRVRARDRAGNVGPWSPELRVWVP